MKTFKVGDKVRIIDNLSLHNLKIGSIVTIEVAKPEHDYCVASGWGLGHEDIELVSRITQNQQIEKHLKSGKSITAMDALVMFRCLNLKGRIYELRQSGMNIKTDMITTTTGKRIGKYSLIKE